MQLEETIQGVTLKKIMFGLQLRTYSHEKKMVDKRFGNISSGNGLEEGEGQKAIPTTKSWKGWFHALLFSEFSGRLS